MRPFLRQPVARALGAILLACALALASGCDGVWGGAALSERDLRERYAMQLLEGAGVGFTPPPACSTTSASRTASG